MEQYLIYLRKSRADMEAENRGEGETLARHERILLDLSKRQKLRIGAIYKEIVSGETIAARPEMQRVLSEVEQGIWTAVIVMEVERLARGDTMDQGLVASTFKYSGTKIITPMKTYDPNNEFDEEYFEFGLFMSRREYKTINRRLQTGRVSAVKEGKFVGNTPPYGWKKVKIQGDSGYTLLPDENTYPIQLLMYELIGNGELQPDGTLKKFLLRDVCNRLENLSIPTMTGSTHWTTAVVRDILRNPHNDGMVRWGWRKNKTIRENGQVRKSRPRGKDDEVFLYPGIHKQYVRLEHSLYTKVQDILDSRCVPAPTNLGIQNPLAGVIVCGFCGHNMIRRSYSYKYPAGLICTQHHCHNISSQINIVEKKLIEALAIWLDGYKLELNQNKESASTFDKKAILENQIKEKEKLIKQNDKIHELLENDVYTVEQFMERSKQIIEKLEAIQSAINLLESEIEKENQLKNSAEKIIPKFQCVLDSYWRLTIQEKNMALKEILEKVEYRKTTRGNRTGEGMDKFELKIFPKIPKMAQHGDLHKNKNKQQPRGAKEMAHAEIISTMVHQLIKGAGIEKIQAGNATDYYVDHTAGVYPQGANGMSFDALAFQSKGDPITDLLEDMAAEQKARTTYENLMRIAKDPEVYRVLKFLRGREIVHFQRFGEALEFVREDLNKSNYYAYNPAFDKK